MALALVGSGCAKSHRRVIPPALIRPSLEATREQLLAQYDQQARAVRSLNAAVELAPVAGSTYTGVIEEYHRVKGFLLAERPARIRVIGQAPIVGKDIFDMTSDSTTFRIFIPSKNKFLVGSTELERLAKKPIENLRPQHLLNALFWPEISAREPVLFEEAEDPPAREYVLTVLRETAAGPEIARKIWFDRADLNVARIEIFGAGGRLVSDVHYGDWEPTDGLRYPREITLRRLHEDYQLGVHITRLTLNEEIAPERFRLEQPPGSELVRVGEEATGTKP